MPHKTYFTVIATEKEARIMRAAANAMTELVSGPSTRAHSFAVLVQQYTGKRVTIAEIEEVLHKSFSQFIVNLYR